MKAFAICLVTVLSAGNTYFLEPSNTRLTLFNEQVGPIVIQDAIEFLGKTIQARLGPPPIDRR